MSDVPSQATQLCGDVLDWLPCPRCGARVLRDCPIPNDERNEAAAIINRTPGLMQKLYDRANAHLRTQEPQP